MNREQAEQIVGRAIDALFDSDLSLLEDDVSEMAIMHKLAQYLQQQVELLNIQDVDVDCEYNRNMEDGPGKPKRIKLLVNERERELEGNGALSEEDFRSVTTFPDIIVHQRRTNDINLLIVEVKKTTNKTSPDFDFKKLCAFTEDTEENSYAYSQGVFILFTTDEQNPPRPELRWFSNGQSE